MIGEGFGGLDLVGDDDWVLGRNYGSGMDSEGERRKEWKGRSGRSRSCIFMPAGCDVKVASRSHEFC